MTSIVIFLFGLTVGSFLNVLIDRIPRHESVTKGRSYCESCGKVLAWHDLIPLFSFISIGGKCRYCKVSLSSQYPLIELLTGILFVFTYWWHFPNEYQISDNILLDIGMYLKLVIILFTISCLIVVFFIDLKYGIIPDKIVFPAIAISFIYLMLNTKYLILLSLLSAFGSFLFFLFLYLITKGKGMGFGDVKLSFLLGLFLGFPKIVVALYLAFLSGSVVSLILIALKKKKLKATIPFGPFLVFGTLVSFFWGRELVKLFLGGFL